MLAINMEDFFELYRLLYLILDSMDEDKAPEILGAAIAERATALLTRMEHETAIYDLAFYPINKESRTDIHPMTTCEYKAAVSENG